jgi:hypothetical protein
MMLHRVMMLRRVFAGPQFQAIVMVQAVAMRGFMGARPPIERAHRSTVEF